MSENRHVAPNHPAYPLVHGTPPERISATEDPRVLVVWLHGEEELAGLVEHHIQTERPDLLANVDYICGNPPAAALGARAQTLDDDLNRSFHLPPDHPRYGSPERKQADELLPRLRRYAHVLDLHTSETDSGMFFLAANPHYPAVEQIIACSTIEKIVVLPSYITAPSLIGNVEPSISIDMNEAVAHTPEAITEVITIIDGLIAGASQVQPRERQFFHVERHVPKDEDPGDVVNFEMCAAGYYPVLFGEGPRSYRNDPSKTYLGFAATKLEVITL